MTDLRVPRPLPPERLWTLDVARESRDGGRVVRVAGRIGAGSAEKLAEALAEELTGGAPRISISLDGVDYISSAGLAVLQDAAARARDKGVRLTVRGLSEHVRLAFEIAGALDQFTIE